MESFFFSPRLIETFFFFFKTSNFLIMEYFGYKNVNVRHEERKETKKQRHFFNIVEMIEYT